MTPQDNIPEVVRKGDSPDSANKGELEDDNYGIPRSNSNQMKLPPERDDFPVNMNNSRVLDKEGKMVTFDDQDDYADETPLMFSRSSSLDSLSEFEQYSIHDDYSSVVSEFSHRTSGVVSPSELPDSPTQTVLPSPRNHKAKSLEFILKIQGEAVSRSIQHLSYKSQIARSNIFEDEVATFKEESTPVEFSTATSLSSLTIDDEIKISNDIEAHYRLKKMPDAVERNVHKIETGMLDMTISGSENKEKEEQVSDSDEDAEDMLAACINVGMQTNRYRQSLKTLNSQKPIQPESSNILGLYHIRTTPSRLESHVPRTPVGAYIGTPKTNETTEISVAPDSVHVYCTEDTPAAISPVGSQSNLSALWMPSVQEDVENIEYGKSAEIDCHRNDLLDDQSSNLSSEDEKILHECIQSGIPKTRQMISPRTNSILFIKEPETLSHSFNVYDTPPSSPVDTNQVKNPTFVESLDSASLQHPDALSDNSPNHSDDEAILTECIQSAMPKARFNMPWPIRSSLSQPTENLKTLNMRTPTTSSAFFQPGYAKQRKNITKNFLSFEDNVSLSEEEDIVLAQCIRSGMPKVVEERDTLQRTKSFYLTAPI